MPRKDSTASTVVPATPIHRRRSPRFLHSDTPQQNPPSTLRRSSRLSLLQKSSPDPAVPKPPEPRSNKVRFSENDSKNSGKSISGSRNCGALSSGSKNSVVLSKRVNGVSNLRRSPRLSEHEGVFLRENFKKSGGSVDGLSKCDNFSSGSVKSLRTNNAVEGFQCLRRSKRISITSGVKCYKEEELSDITETENFAAKSKKETRMVLVGPETKGEIPGKGSKKSCVLVNGSSNCGNLSYGSIKSFKTNKVTDGFQSLRRSQRISSISRVKCYKEEELSDIEEEEDFAASSERETKMVFIGPEQTKEEINGKCRLVEVSRKTKRDECEESNGAVQGWTKEQELALQRAYLVVKPTPHFWKKVSKLVPGKSAQDCFDKINSDFSTPPEHQPVSRAKKRINSSPVSRAKKRINSSPIPHLHLSASKVLIPTEKKVRRPRYNKQKRNILHKNARQLLRMHHCQNQDHKADLFSVFEPNVDLSTQAFQHGIILSTPKHLQENRGFLQKFNDRSSSGHKKPLSRFSASRGKAPSPPVLKQVKNKVLHEKYIDQLHNRDAKRKTASEQAIKSTLRTEDRKAINVPKSDVVRTAKNALVSDAITMLQRIQTNAKSNSSDLDNDDDDEVFNSDGDESETEI